MSITAGRDARLGVVASVRSCAATSEPYRYWRVGPTTGVAAGTRRPHMTSSPPRSHTQHMAFLAGITALNAVHSLTEISRASGRSRSASSPTARGG